MNPGVPLHPAFLRGDGIHRRALACLLAAVLCPTAHADVVAIQEPRAYGHVIGDLLTRDVTLALPAGRTLDSDALPRPGRIDAWLELHSLAVAPAEGAVHLRLQYQVVNVGPEVVTTVLPALRLPLRGGAAGESETLPDWPVHLSPLTPRFAVARGALESLQPDIAPARESVAPLLLRLCAYALLALLLAWPTLASRFPQLAFWRRHAPFRHAWRELRALRRSGDEGESLRRAFTRLHAAFDASAGAAVFGQQLEPLYRARPSLRAASREIEAFFAASRQAFFAPDQAMPPYSLARALALARTLARLEVAR